jgi:hypothetical protein
MGRTPGRRIWRSSERYCGPQVEEQFLSFVVVIFNVSYALFLWGGT